MASWNDVKHYQTGNNIVTLELTDDSTSSNRMYYTSMGQLVLGAMTPAVYEDGTLA